MPADDPRRHTSGAFEGFRSFADDTPRSPEAVGERHAESDLPFEARPRPARPPLAWRPALLAVGAVAGLAAGAVLVMDGPSAERAESAVGTALPVEVAEVKPLQPPPVSSSEPLEVLSAANGRPTVDLAPDVPAPRPPARTVEAEAAADVEPRIEPEVESAEPRTPQFAVTGVPASVLVIEPPARDPCADAPSPAAEMVCRDPELAAADRRMRRAYAAALAAGAPREALALEQQDWREIRELAARRSPRDVASIYRQRTDELWRMADRPWR